ncbi:hypothetical protein AL048_28595 [Pseudomonas syringae pv. castaneae]|nr:hypothetical protein AL048_28595 [Pseudomonas syringae pv. castaneae]
MKVVVPEFKPFEKPTFSTESAESCRSRTEAGSRLLPFLHEVHVITSTNGGNDMNVKTTSSYQPWNKGKLVGQKILLRQPNACIGLGFL